MWFDDLTDYVNKQMSRNWAKNKKKMHTLHTFIWIQQQHEYYNLFGCIILCTFDFYPNPVDIYLMDKISQYKMICSRNKSYGFQLT